MKGQWGTIVRRAVRTAPLSALCFCSAVASTSYYVSARGDDADAGTSKERPWRTIDRVNAAAFSPGDIVYFHAGDRFEGTIIAEFPGVTYDAYGRGRIPLILASASGVIPEAEPGADDAKPVISGAVKVGSWKSYRGAVYAARVQQAVKNLFLNGAQMTLARFPNRGFLTVEETDGKTKLRSSALTQKPGTWNGAQIRIRSTNYTFETRPVETYADGTLRLAPHVNDYPKNFSYGITKGYGFYLDNSLEALDAPGEWYYDGRSKTLYFRAPGNANPNTLDVEASVYPYGFRSAKNSMTVKNLDFRYQAVSAIAFDGTTKGGRVESVSISCAMMHGIEVGGVSSSYVIDRTTIDRVNGRGILLERSSNTVVSNNRITRIGLVPGIGIDNEHGMTGIVMLGGSGTTIRGNRIDSTGYIGIRCDGSNNLVERNTITNVMLKLSDGGALYAYGENLRTFGTVWKDNTIINAPGNIDGTVSPQPEAHGLYWDFKCRKMTAVGNTIEGTRSSGLFMQYGCSENTIRNNTIYRCGENPIHIYTNVKYPYGGHTIKGNIFYSEGQLASMYLQFADAEFHRIGVLDSNYYSSSVKSPAVKRVYKEDGWKSQDYSLTQWQEISGEDRHSHEIYKQPASFFARFKRK